MVGHGFLTTSIVYVRSVRARRQQLHFTHSRPEMKRERSRQLNCRKPPLAFRCVITKTAAKSKYFQIRFTRRRLNGKLIAALRQLQPEVGGFLAKRHGALRQLYRSSTKQRTVRLPTPKPGRNDPCPCGSGKKFKRCCGLDKRGQMARGVTA